MKKIENIMKRLIGEDFTTNKLYYFITTIIIIILLFLFGYKNYSYKKYIEYKNYISYSNKRANYYYELRRIKWDAEDLSNYRDNGEYIKFKVKEYYFSPIKARNIVEGEGVYFDGKEEKEIYGLYLYINGDNSIYDNIFIYSKEELEELKKVEIMYKFNEEELEEFFEKVERKSSEINE